MAGKPRAGALSFIVVVNSRLSPYTPQSVAASLAAVKRAEHAALNQSQNTQQRTPKIPNPHRFRHAREHTHTQRITGRTRPTHKQGESTASHNTPSSVEMFDQTDHIIPCVCPAASLTMDHASSPQLHRHLGWADKELRGSRRQSLSVDQPSRRREGPHCIVDPTGRAKSISLSRFFGIANQGSHCLKR